MRELVNLLMLNTKRLFRNKNIIVIIPITSLSFALLFGISGTYKIFENTVCILCFIVSVCIVSIQMIQDKHSGLSTTISSIIASKRIILTSRFIQVVFLYLLELAFFSVFFFALDKVGLY